QAEDGIRDTLVTGVQTCALPISRNVISANGRGVDLFSGDDNTVQGNFIGTDVTGTVVLSNPNVGVNTNGTSNNFIGGLTATPGRSEERRVGKECRCRWSTEHAEE